MSAYRSVAIPTKHKMMPPMPRILRSITSSRPSPMRIIPQTYIGSAEHSDIRLKRFQNWCEIRLVQISDGVESGTLFLKNYASIPNPPLPLTITTQSWNRSNFKERPSSSPATWSLWYFPWHITRTWHFELLVPCNRRCRFLATAI